jgi:hypothetical protein
VIALKLQSDGNPYPVAIEPVVSAEFRDPFHLRREGVLRSLMNTEPVLDLKNQNKNYSGFALFISGDVSPRARDELSKRGVRIYERQLPGPLR